MHAQIIGITPQPRGLPLVLNVKTMKTRVLAKYTYILLVVCTFLLDYLFPRHSGQSAAQNVRILIELNPQIGFAPGFYEPGPPGERE